MAVAMLLVTAGIQQALTSSEPLVGGVTAVVGIAIALGYQYLEDDDHRRVYDDVVASIGEENLRELSNLTAEEIRKLKAQASDQE